MICGDAVAILRVDVHALVQQRLDGGRVPAARGGGERIRLVGGSRCRLGRCHRRGEKRGSRCCGDQIVRACSGPPLFEPYRVGGPIVAHVASRERIENRRGGDRGGERHQHHHREQRRRDDVQVAGRCSARSAPSGRACSSATPRPRGSRASPSPVSRAAGEACRRTCRPSRRG